MALPRIFICILASFFLQLSCIEEIRDCCNHSEKYVSPISPSNSFEIDSFFTESSQIRFTYTRLGLYANFGFQFLIRDSAFYLVFLNSAKDSLVFINVFRNNDYEIVSTKGFIDPRKKYTIKIVNDTLHLLNIENYNYNKIRIKKDFGLEITSECSLHEAFESKKLFLNSNLVVDKKLAFFDPYLISFYGNYKTKNNLGSKAWMKINCTTGRKEELFEYPKEYRYCFQRDFYSLIEKFSDSSVLAIFRKLNRIYQVNIYSGKIMQTSGEFTFKSNFMCYNKEQERNLAYTSKYDLLDEENSNLISHGDKIFLVKRLMRKEKSSPIKCAILLFDKNLNHIDTYYPGKAVQPRLSFGYKNGIVLLSDSLNRIYYYGFKGNK